MRNFKDEVFVIKSINYSEADKIITVFGKQRGKFSLLAKGVRKLTSKNRGNIQTFSISKTSYYQALGMPILLETESIKIVDYKDIKSENAQRVLFLLNKFLAEDTQSKKIFKALEILIDKEIDDEYTNKFRMVFLKEEGILGSIKECSICKLSDNLEYLNTDNFALICSNCYINKGIKKGLRIDENIYSSPIFTTALDRYIQKIYSDII